MTKKTSAEKRIEVQKEALGEIVAGFTLRGIEFKNKDNFWDLKIAIQGDVKEYSLTYNLCLDYNEQGDKDSIAELEDKIGQMENENTLFGKEKERMISEFKNAIKEIDQSRITTKKELGEIKFLALTASFVAQSGVVVFRVQAEVVEQIIKKLPLIDKYKITLTPASL